jgi:FkbM family methyltransferase
VRLPWTTRDRGDVPDASTPEPPRIPSLGNGLTVPIRAEDYPALLESLRVDPLPEAHPDFYVDWDGIRTRVAMLPFAPADLAGRVSTRLPIPDDGYRSEDVEYASLAQALLTATDTFRIVEVGAGWAPWSVAGIVQARRRELRATGIAVEADEIRSGWAMQHASDNDVLAQLITGEPDEIAAALAEPWGEVELRVVRAAGWHTRTMLQFPDLDEGDMGGAVWTLPGTDVDYRGAHLSHHDVPAVSIDDLLDASELTDLLHVDVQGVEYDLVEPASDVIQRKVRLMAIGTTDRLIEGRLQQHFLSRGWGLAIDDPCTAVFTMTHPTLAGFTVQDGTQLWENPFVRKDFAG